MYNDTYLSHYGVPGMKWGVRKQRIIDKRNEKKQQKQLAKKNKEFYGRYVKDDWTKSYNKAADKMDIELNRLNKKYEGKKILDSKGNYTKIGKQYVSEVDTAWKKVYSKELLDTYGEAPDVGKKWVEAAPMYSMYSISDIKEPV